MDIVGGKGICLGPANFLARGYQGAPIAVTVEGANILTRSMIIFGQGAIRCHPYVLREMEAAYSPNSDAVEKFDSALAGHVGFVLSNLVRSLWLGLTDGYGSQAPTVMRPSATTNSLIVTVLTWPACGYLHGSIGRFTQT